MTDAIHTTSLARNHVQGAAEKSSPLHFFCSFLRNDEEFQREISHTYVVITYVHIGINSI